MTAPNKGDAGGDNPIGLGLAGRLGGLGVNPTALGLDLRNCQTLAACSLLQNNESAPKGGGVLGNEGRRGASSPAALPPGLSHGVFCASKPSQPLEGSPISFFVVWL